MLTIALMKKIWPISALIAFMLAYVMHPVLDDTLEAAKGNQFKTLTVRVQILDENNKPAVGKLQMHIGVSAQVPSKSLKEMWNFGPKFTNGGFLLLPRMATIVGQAYIPKYRALDEKGEVADTYTAAEIEKEISPILDRADILKIHADRINFAIDSTKNPGWFTDLRNRVVYKTNSLTSDRKGNHTLVINFTLMDKPTAGSQESLSGKNTPNFTVDINTYN